MITTAADVLPPTFVAFVESCVDADESVALAATQGRWKAVPDRPGRDYADVVVEQPPDRDLHILIAEAGGRTYLDADDAAHVAAWGPARALDECESKRRILASYRVAAARMEAVGRCGAAPGLVRAEARGRLMEARAAVLAAAWVYTGRPGYRESWRG